MVNNKITILHFNTNPSGGAYKAAERLHEAFLEEDFNSYIVTKYPNRQKIRNSISYRESIEPMLLERIGNKLRYRPKNIAQQYYALWFNEKKSKLPKKELRYYASFKPDIIILNWVTAYLAAGDIQKLQNLTGAKIFWNLLDKGPLTSICHYTWDCQQYTSVCRKCPISKNKKFQRIVKTTHEYRQSYYNKTNLNIIAPTSELYKQAKASSNFKNKNINYVPLSINTKVFKSLSKDKSKKELGISPNKKVIFFGVSRHSEVRKGIVYLNKALKILKERIGIKSIVLLIAGHDSDQNIYAEIGYEVKSMGAINSDEILNLCYNAADIFVSPSIEDSGPMMINESICCQTPIVAFNIGVANDFIKNRVNGSIVPLYNCNRMAEEINYHLFHNNCVKRFYQSEEGEKLIKMLSPFSQTEKIISIYNAEKE